jgi:hypothetical protein
VAAESDAEKGVCQARAFPDPSDLELAPTVQPLMEPTGQATDIPEFFRHCARPRYSGSVLQLDINFK